MCMYYYGDKSRKPAGPVSLEELEKMVESGELPPGTWVAQEDDKKWVPVEDVAHVSAKPHQLPPSVVSPSLSRWGCFTRPFAHYLDASGRACRREYWPFMLVFGTIWWFLLATSFVHAGVAYMVHEVHEIWTARPLEHFIRGAGGAHELLIFVDGFFAIPVILALAMAPGLFALQIRRLHDVGLRGWWAFLPPAFFACTLFCTAIIVAPIMKIKANLIASAAFAISDAPESHVEPELLRWSQSLEEYSPPESISALSQASLLLFLISLLVLLTLSACKSNQGKNLNP